ncbi:MAG: helix-turn-helix transcriptional regulator [Pelagimonas sp.]|jgi:transcriptional regulator with XRE-family HTH domain|nr:helix-turn-helix transcriptional regulator [Pelagimonas sp.]
MKRTQSDLRSVAKIRMQLSENLKELVQRKGGNASQFARDTGINRTQFNRYLIGESWPRPDVLDRICQYTGTDARIMTKPLAEIEGADNAEIQLLRSEMAAISTLTAHALDDREWSLVEQANQIANAALEGDGE